MKMRKMIALFACAAIAVTSAGCSGGGGTKDGGQGNLEKLMNAQPDEVTLPLVETPVKMTVASTISVTSAGQTFGLGDIEAFKELERRTGVQIEYQTVSEEKLNLLFASNNLPDMILTDWDKFGGTYKYAMDGQLIALDDLIMEHSPDFLNVLKKDKSILDNTLDVDKHIYLYPFIRPEMELRVFEGFQIRRDWLEKLNLEIPQTVDDLYKVLKAFKEQDPNGNGKQDEVPIISDKKLPFIDHAMNWFGIDAFYQDNGEVKCGWLQPEYKEFLETMSKWYSEGLIDADYLTCDTTQFRSKAVNELAGVWYGRAAGTLGTLEAAMSSVNPDFSIIGMPWLSKTEGGTGYAMPSKYIDNVTNIGMAITSNCQNPEIAAKWCNYAYGKEGHLLFNFGIEGDSYTMEDGIPTYTQNIMKNPNGLSVSEALSRYAIPGNYAMEQSIYYFDQFMTGSQKNAIDVWKKGDTARTLPTLKYDQSELEYSNNLKNEINTYVAEMQSKIIVGKEPMSSYDTMIEEIKKMGIDKVVETIQTAYDRTAAN